MRGKMLFLREWELIKIEKAAKKLGLEENCGGERILVLLNWNTWPIKITQPLWINWMQG